MTPEMQSRLLIAVGLLILAPSVLMGIDAALLMLAVWEVYDLIGVV